VIGVLSVPLTPVIVVIEEFYEYWIWMRKRKRKRQRQG
jgi:membrane-anchored protein YejM (alkaline phosphatase superfamily)